MSNNDTMNNDSINAGQDSPQSGLNILLVRPGLTELEEQGRIVGTLSIPLSERGEEEASQMARQLAEQQLEIIYVAPTLSADQTATFLNEGRNVKVKVDESLVNVDHGLWQGMKIEDLQTNQPRLVRKWEEFPESVCPPAGEPIEDVLPRVEKLLKKVFRKFKSGNVVIVAPEPLASIISSVLRGNRISDLLKAQAQSSGVEMIEVGTEYVAAIAGR